MDIQDYYQDDWKDRYKDKICPAQVATSMVKHGNHVFIGTGCGEPQHLIKAMISNEEISDIDLYQALPFTLSQFFDQPFFWDRFLFNTFFITSLVREAAFEGKINYIPACLSEIPSLFDSQILLDVALIQVTPPDEHGYCSLGISVDITKRAAETAKLIIAQVNSHMPRTLGNSFIHASKIDYLVPYDEPLIEVKLPEPDKSIRRIARNISRLVEDNSTIEVGIGTIPYSVLSFLGKKKNLGIHTEMLSDVFLDLIAKGVITNEQKNLHQGKIIASFCMGTQSIYRFVHNNPMVEFYTSDYVNDPFVIALNDNMVAINSALEIDLTGQICSDSIGYHFFSGIGGQVDFSTGAAKSKGGISIIALPSTAKNGTISRIVPHLSEGAGVVITRGGAHYVVTEYGIGYLRGKNIRQRVMELIKLAHPSFRRDLLASAKHQHYIFPDQIPLPDKDLIFLDRLESNMELGDGKKIMFRPILPTDEFAFRNFIYSFSEESLYNRFFQVIRTWPHPKAQQWVNIDYEKTMTLIGIIEENDSFYIVAMGQYGEDIDGNVELSLLVQEEYQSQGIGQFMLGLIRDIAIKNGYTEGKMRVLFENKKMLELAKKLFPELRFKPEAGGILNAEFKL